MPSRILFRGVRMVDPASGRDGVTDILIEDDVVAALDALVPRDDRWRHRHGSPGHGADHLLPVFVSPSVTIPVQGGRLALGTWQRVVLVDTNRENNRREVVLTFVPA